MQSNDIRAQFLTYFQERGHTIVPSSPLIPDDPSVLLTTAGMQQFKPYYRDRDPNTTVHPSIGKPIGENAASIQKSFRTSDIDEVGDESHLTFFEMLGNFSFGGYFKKEAIVYAYEFLTAETYMNLDISYVTVFDPSRVPDDDWRKDVPFDEDSYRIWKEEIGLSEEMIKREGMDNFWGPTGNSGPCGPTTEIYVANKNGVPVEIWNVVFNEFYCNKEKQLERLERPGVDTGMGLERLTMVSQQTATIFETDLFEQLFALLPDRLDMQKKRIVADHMRGIAFLIADGLRPSNKEAGYVLRRLMRRVITYMHEHNDISAEKLLQNITSHYGSFYTELDAKTIIPVFHEEYNKFSKTLRRGMKELEKMDVIDAKSAFTLYESFGLPYEIIKEAGGEKASTLTRSGFDEELERHREASRAGQEKKFGGHGLILDTGELKAENKEEMQKVIRLHTATHLLQAALRRVLGDDIRQAGSDITAKRTRFDFTFPRKVTDEERAKVEDLVNEMVSAGHNVIMEEMSYEEAIEKGALAFFKEKYPERVTVYSIVDAEGNVISRELCGGPHVKNTKEIGHVRITKEESVGAGVRRIRATVE